MTARHGLAIVLLLLAAVASAQTPQPVSIIAPDPVTVTTVLGHGETRVYYTTTNPKLKPTLTNFGPLVAGQSVALGPVETRGVVSSVLVRVDAKIPMAPGDQYSGALVFTDGVKEAMKVAVTVAEAPAAAFTLDPSQVELCLDCMNERKLVVNVTNSGKTTISSVSLGPLSLRDAAGQNQWVMQPAQPSSVDIPPGATGAVTVLLDPPPAAAGTYSGTLRITANGVPSQPLALTIRIPGPEGHTLLPVTLFFLALLVGAALAFALEQFFGAGGGAERAQARIDLSHLRDNFSGVLEWIDAWDAAHTATPLANARVLVGVDIDTIDRLLADSEDLTPAELTQAVKELRTTLRKRELLRRFAENAPATAAKLDAVDSTKSYDDYLKALSGVAAPPAATGVAPASLKTIAAPGGKPAPALPWYKRAGMAMAELWAMRGVRYAALVIAVIASAYLALYATKKCTFGSAADYVTTFLWALGLTGAGKAILTQAKYTS